MLSVLWPRPISTEEFDRRVDAGEDVFDIAECEIIPDPGHKITKVTRGNPPAIIAGNTPKPEGSSTA
jgi:hypothetical protein